MTEEYVGLSTDEEDDFSESDDLMDSILYGVREFYLKGSWNELMLGVMLDESEDSFLVAMPALLFNTEKVVHLMPAIDRPYVRFIKAEFRAVALPSESNNAIYMAYVSHKAPAEFPELLEMLATGEVPVEIEGELPISKEVEGTSTKPKVEKKTLAQLEKEGVLVTNKGLTEAGVRSILEDALSKASLIPNGGNTKFPN